MQHAVLMDTLFGVDARPLQASRCLLLIAIGVLFLTISSRLSFHLPYSLVPVTAQTMVVLLIGLTYGRRLAATTLGTWLLAGSCGLPVFAMPATIPLFMPTGGYLIGHFLAATFCAYLAERGWTHSFGKLALALLLAHALIYIPGLAQLSLFVKKDVLALGFYPFLIGDIFKAVLVVLTLPPVCRYIQKTKA